MYLSPHFDSSEFRCKCGCGQETVKGSLIERLEKLYNAMNARAIIINSGFRCPSYSVKVGGMTTDAHTKGFAADIKVKKQDGTFYSSLTIAEQAEKLGFGGIGIMSNGSCHVDTRDVEPYANSHWWADEVTGKKYSTFSGLGEEIINSQTPVSTDVSKEKNTKPITIKVGEEIIFEGKVTD